MMGQKLLPNECGPDRGLEEKQKRKKRERAEKYQGLTGYST